MYNQRHWVPRICRPKLAHYIEVSSTTASFKCLYEPCTQKSPGSSIVVPQTKGAIGGLCSKRVRFSCCDVTKWQKAKFVTTGGRQQPTGKR